MSCKSKGTVFCRFFSTVSTGALIYGAYKASSYIAAGTSSLSKTINTMFNGNTTIPEINGEISFKTIEVLFNWLKSMDFKFLDDFFAKLKDMEFSDFMVNIKNLNFPTKYILPEDVQSSLKAAPGNANYYLQILVWGTTAMLAFLLLERGWKSCLKNYFCPPEKKKAKPKSIELFPMSREPLLPKNPESPKVGIRVQRS